MRTIICVLAVILAAGSFSSCTKDEAVTPSKAHAPVKLQTGDENPPVPPVKGK